MKLFSSDLQERGLAAVESEKDKVTLEIATLQEQIRAISLGEAQARHVWESNLNKGMGEAREEVTRLQTVLQVLGIISVLFFSSSRFWFASFAYLRLSSPVLSSLTCFSQSMSRVHIYCSSAFLCFGISLWYVGAKDFVQRYPTLSVAL